MAPPLALDTIIYDLMLAIARGAHAVGDTLPQEGVIAQEMVVSPRRIVEAYEVLARLEVVVAMDEHGYMVDSEGKDRARRWLVEKFRRTLTQDLGVLLGAGCGGHDVQAAVASALEDVLEKQGNNL